MPLRPGGGRHPWRGLEKSQRTFFGKQSKRTLPTLGCRDGRGSQRASSSLLPSSNHYYKEEARFLPGCLGPASYSPSSLLPRRREGWCWLQRPWWGRVGGGMHTNPLHQLLTKTLTLYPFNKHFINKSLEKGLVSFLGRTECVSQQPPRPTQALHPLSPPHSFLFLASSQLCSTCLWLLEPHHLVLGRPGIHTGLPGWEEAWAQTGTPGGKWSPGAAAGEGGTQRRAQRGHTLFLK